MIEIRQRTAKNEVFNTKGEMTLSGTISELNEQTVESVFTICLGDMRVNYTGRNDSEGVITENISGSKNLLDEARIFARETIAEFEALKTPAAPAAAPAAPKTTGKEGGAK